MNAATISAATILSTLFALNLDGIRLYDQGEFGFMVYLACPYTGKTYMSFEINYNRDAVIVIVINHFAGGKIFECGLSDMLEQIGRYTKDLRNVLACAA